MKKLMAVLLAVIMMTQFCFGFTITASADTEETKSVVEELANDYIKMYIENTFLYTEHDLSESTIKGVMLDDAKVSDATIAQTGSAKYATATGDISFVEDVADYYTYIRASQNIQRYNFEYAIHVTDTIVNEDHATVQLFTEVSFQYTPEDEMSYIGDYYTVELLRMDNNWYIANMTSDGMEAEGLSKQTFDYCDAVAQFDSYYANLDFELDSEADSEQLEVIDASNGSVEPQTIDGLNTVLDYSRTYNRTNAIAYANTYSSANYTAPSGNDPKYLNGLFAYYEERGNCQNFVSQAVWAGFGGSNTASGVNIDVFPMDNTGTHRWYGTKNDGPLNWAYVDHFADYVSDSNNDNDDIGMKGNIYNINPGNDFSSVITNRTSLLGAVLHVNYDAGEYGHAILLTDASGLSFDKVKYCGNSPMCRQVLLSDSGYTYNARLRLIIPTTMRRIQRCEKPETGKHNFPTTTADGTPCTCKKCGFCRLTVTPNMMRPMKAGTATVSGSANFPCFRMAIGITSPSGRTTWKEFSNTRNASTTYNFSEKGLYTIKLCGRDVSTSAKDTSDKPVTSTNVTTVFTVRIW